MRKQITVAIFAGVLASAACLAVMSAAQSQVAPTTGQALPLWKPVAAMSRQLGVRIHLHDYSIQPPLNAIFQDRDAQNGYAFIWKGKGEDAIAPSLWGAIVAMSPYQKTPKPEPLLNASMEAIKRRFITFSHTAIQQGRIGSLTFARTRWTGTNTQHQTLEGFTYLCVDGRTLLTLNGREVKPAEKAADTSEYTSASADANDTQKPSTAPGDANSQQHTSEPTALQVAEAAVLTLRKP